MRAVFEVYTIILWIVCIGLFLWGCCYISNQRETCKSLGGTYDIGNQQCLAIPRIKMPGDK